MSQINRKFASFFVVFAAVVVYQFSIILAVAILVIAVFLYQGFQMSDFTINVPSSSRAHSLVSSLYSWTESAVSSVAKKCKNLTASETESNARLPIQSSNSLRNIKTKHTFSPSSESASLGNRENIYQGTSIHQSSRVSDNAPRASVSSSTVTTSEWNRKSSIASSSTSNKSLTATSRYDYDNDSFLRRSSPWGYSLIPQQRNSASDARPVTAAASPLSPSSRYSNNRDAALFVDVNSPGFSSRLLKYHSEAAIHQPQYTRPGQLPLVHLNTSPLPTLSARNSQKVRSPVRVRIAPPTYDSSESRLFARSEKQPLAEQQSKSVIEVLKEISRKRMHTEDGGSDAKRHHPQSDSSSSSSSSSSPAMVNGVLSEPAPTGKRPREEDSPKLQKPTVKRTRNNEIYSSLSSSRNINVGTKRKAADSWSRCSTPVPIGKHLKKSPHIASNVSNDEENDDTKSIEEHTPQREPSPLPKPAPERKLQQMVGRTPSPSVNLARSVDAKSSSHHSLESINEETDPSKSQKARSQHHGRLFVKSFSRGIASETEGMKDSRKNGGTKPWKTQRTIDADAITGEDIVGQDIEIGSRRLNSMFSVLQSKGSSSNDQFKGDMVDAGPSKVDTLKPPSNATEPEKNASNTSLPAKGLSNPTHNSVEQLFPTTTPASSSESVSEGPDKEAPSTSNSQPTPTPTFGSLQNPLPSSNPPFVDKEKSSSTPPISQPPPAVNFSSGSSIAATSSSTLSFTSITPASNTSVLTRPTTTPAVTATETQSKVITSAATTIPSGIFGSPSTATFTVPQQSEKPPATTASTFTFGASSTTGVSSIAVSSSSFGLPTSSTTSTPAATTQALPTVAPSFGVLSQSSSTTVPTSITDTKTNAPASASGGFSFGASPSVVSQASSLGGFSMPITTASSGISFGVSSNAPSISTFAPTSTVTSSQNAPSTVTTTADSGSSKPFGFGATQQDSAQSTSAPSSTGGFNFQFGSNTSSTLAAPKPQDSSAGFKFSFGANKGEGGLSTPQQSTNPVAKPPAFGEGFAFGAASTNTNSEEPKPMAFGTPTSLTPTMPAPSAAPPPSGGFNFTADANASSSTLKPSFGFGTSNVGGATAGSVLGSAGGGFNFGAKPSDPPAVAPAPAAPSLGSPFQFGANSQVLPSSSTLQSQAQTVNSPFSLGGATEQKPPVLSGGFSFGSTSSSTMSPLQQNAPAFGQSSVPSFGSPSINPLQSQQPAPAPSLFQFGSGGSNMSQPGISSGGFNFGGATAPGVPPSGFNFNPTGPSATTPFQFGANPLQPGMSAPAMFSIGSGSTAPRSRPRNRRQK